MKEGYALLEKKRNEIIEMVEIATGSPLRDKFTRYTLKKWALQLGMSKAVFARFLIDTVKCPAMNNFIGFYVNEIYHPSYIDFLQEEVVGRDLDNVTDYFPYNEFIKKMGDVPRKLKYPYYPFTFHPYLVFKKCTEHWGMGQDDLSEMLEKRGFHPSHSKRVFYPVMTPERFIEITGIEESGQTKRIMEEEMTRENIIVF